MEQTDQKTKDKLKKDRIENVTDEEFPPTKAIHKQLKLEKKLTRENHINLSSD